MGPMDTSNDIRGGVRGDSSPCAPTPATPMTPYDAAPAAVRDWIDKLTTQEQSNLRYVAQHSWANGHAHGRNPNGRYAGECSKYAYGWMPPKIERWDLAALLEEAGKIWAPMPYLHFHLAVKMAAEKIMPVRAKKADYDYFSIADYLRQLRDAE